MLFCGVLICSLFSIFAHAWKQVLAADLNEKTFINLRGASFALRLWSSSVDHQSFEQSFSTKALLSVSGSRILISSNSGVFVYTSLSLLLFGKVLVNVMATH